MLSCSHVIFFEIIELNHLAARFLNAIAGSATSVNRIGSRRRSGGAFGS
jgi:hypothetical protein